MPAQTHLTVTHRRVLILNGPCGVGKTTLAGAISDALLPHRHALFDLDALAWVYPRPGDDPFGQRLALAQLARPRPALEADGPLPLILPHVWESDADLDHLTDALPGSRITHVLMLAPVAVMEARLARREAGEALRWHCDRARVLDAALRSGPFRRHIPDLTADLTLDTADMPPDRLARLVLGQTGWPS